jgi:AraC family transcriptional regulator
MFHMLTGMTVADYIRQRKLTLAAQELAMSSAKVLDVALKYGYDSPEWQP